MPPTVPQRGGPGALKHRAGAVSGKTILGSKRHRKIKKDTILGITKPDIRRLARRGGVLRISASIYDEVRHALRDRLHKILERCVIYTEYRKAKTVSASDVIFSLKAFGRPIYGFDPSTYQPPQKKRPDGVDMPN